MKAKMVCRALVLAALLAGWSVGTVAAQQEEVQAKGQRVGVLLQQFNEAYKAGRYAEAERLAARACEMDPTSGAARAARRVAREIAAAQPEKPTAATRWEERLRQALSDYTAKLNDLSVERAAVEQKRAELKVQLAALEEKADRMRGQMKALEGERERPSMIHFRRSSVTAVSIALRRPASGSPGGRSSSSCGQGSSSYRFSRASAASMAASSARRSLTRWENRMRATS
jgi:chromosome segregation ATPase